MAKMDQSTVSTNALAFQPGSSAMRLSSQTSQASWQRISLMVAAWVEILVGASFILALNAQSQLIFGTTTEGAGAGFARIAGIGLMALGIACLPSKHAEANRGPVRALLAYNIGATIFFAWVGVATTFQGVLLWPVVILHAVISIALALSLRHGTLDS